jgi:hypothetical protein
MMFRGHGAIKAGRAASRKLSISRAGDWREPLLIVFGGSADVDKDRLLLAPRVADGLWTRCPLRHLEVASF